ncbi:response regulator transcription factor [Rhizobacter sp. J219]|uniref:response regulator n=1 Tax=Rhizobacter sp. J219 TaxID=2898430 RepID=UPI002150A0B9|nr:response regulator transcription factor [Rhizobacter sp. J219]MCR5882123.1 response regulator transcription factor [Rhizobacter sp. J219]
MTLRIALVDDHAAMRGALQRLLERQPGWSVVVQADGGHAAVRAIAACAPQPPDVVLLDMELRDLDGLSVAALLLARWPRLRILMLSWHDDLPLVRAAAEAGCHGYVLKDDPPAELIHAVGEVAAGRHHLSTTLRRAQTSGDPISVFC